MAATPAARCHAGGVALPCPAVTAAFLLDTLACLQLAALAALAVYAANGLVLLAAHFRLRRAAAARKADLVRRFGSKQAGRPLPRVTVQLAVFNERFVVERLLAAVAALDYPAGRLEIQVLDDSTDATTRLVRDKVRELRGRGVDIRHIHRPHREGFKAGALASALGRAKGEFIALFDADFIPPADFLKRALPFFADPRVGLVQAAWGHLNAGENLLTRLQAVAIDGHFALEQAPRAWAGWFLGFNGSAGLWRREAIEAAGGWQTDTLTEDLDLSYRAQLAGWKLEVDLDLVCPAELPASLAAFRAQQRRWARGSLATARKLLGRVFAAPLPPVVKLEALLHLTRYLAHPLALLALLLAPPALYAPLFSAAPTAFPGLDALLWLGALAPGAAVLAAQGRIRPHWGSRLRYLPALMMLAAGLGPQNSRAALAGLLGRSGLFERTPKRGAARPRPSGRRAPGYAEPAASALPEIALGLYALGAFGLHAAQGRIFSGAFLLIYAAGLLGVGALALRGRHPRPHREACGHGPQGVPGPLPRRLEPLLRLRPAEPPRAADQELLGRR